MVSKSVLNRAQQNKVVDGLVEQGVVVEQGRAGHHLIKFPSGAAVTMNFATGDQAGITRAKTIVRGQGLLWPLDPKPRVTKAREVKPRTEPVVIPKQADLTKSPVFAEPNAVIAAPARQITHSSSILEEWIDLTPEMAKVYLERNLGNRPVRPGHVETLMRDMVAGKWRATGEAIKFDYNNVLIDGQHRLLAVAKSGVTIRVLLVLGLDPEVRDVIDTPAHRTAGDALHFNGVMRYQNQIAAAAKVGILYEGGRYTNALDKVNLSLTNSEVMEWVAAHPDIQDIVAFGTMSARELDIPSPSAWIYAIYVLNRVDAEQMREFVTSMTQMRLEGPGDPRVAMMNSIRTARQQRRVVRAPEVLYMVFRTWNAWRKEEALRKLQLGAPGTSGTSIPKPV